MGKYLAILRATERGITWGLYASMSLFQITFDMLAHSDLKPFKVREILCLGLKNRCEEFR